MGRWAFVEAFWVGGILDWHVNGIRGWKSFRLGFGIGKQALGYASGQEGFGVGWVLGGWVIRLVMGR